MKELAYGKEKPSYFTALRNSLIVFIKWPGYAFGIVLFNAAIFALSVWLWFPWLICTFSQTSLVTAYGLKEILAEAARHGKFYRPSL